jgi:hypothetical protein
VSVQHSQTELLEVVAKLHASGGFTGRLHGRQKQSDAPINAITTSTSTSVKANWVARQVSWRATMRVGIAIAGSG